ncbi:MAG: hypothetical protein M3312_04230 [Actinomycetota bacterium]|nr:hypothetical protein [Actinomycetota bacterium]
MADAVSVVFSGGGRVYSFDPAGLKLSWNENVICQTSRGQELARVVKEKHELREQRPAPLPRVVRRATAADLERAAENKREAKSAMVVVRELVRRYAIPVKPVSVEIVFDGSRAVVSYEGERRSGLHRLQAELRERLGRRVELRSVGPRERARLCGDFGLCGTKHCCRRFPSHEKPITLRMAKDQDVALSSSRITGLCGRLRCCLAYEHPLYESFRTRAPRVDRPVETPFGTGVVTGYKVLEDACEVRLDGASTSVAVRVDDCRELGRDAPRERA